MDTATVLPTTDTGCQRCTALTTHDPCCSSHGVLLCCKCYRRTHFVEVRPCCSIDAASMRAEAEDLPPCELGELEPPCDVCDGTGEVLDAPGRGGRAVLPCLNCDAYDRQQELLADQYDDSRED